MSRGNETVTVERDGPVATVTLNRPKVFNAFNAGMRAELATQIDSLNSDAAIRIVVLQGAGPGFCAGADLGEGMPESITRQIEDEYKPILMGIALSDKLWIAAIEGSAAGIGGATWQLLQAMGHKKALETIIEGRKIDAADCLAHGLVNRVVPPETASEAAREWARNLSAGAPLAQAAAKRALRHIGRMRLQDAITLEAKLQQKLVESEDFRSGVAAFFEKRKPLFKGS